MVWVRFNLKRRHRTLGSDAQMEKAMVNKFGANLRGGAGLGAPGGIAIAVLIIVGVAAAAYPGGLLPAVTGAIGTVVAAL